MLEIAAALSVLTQAAPAAVADIAVSTHAVHKVPPITFQLDTQEERAERKRSMIGVKGGIKEGKPLEMLVWGGGGAVIGSIGGPIGAAIGGGVGALAGLIYSVVTVPHNGPAAARKPGAP